MTSAFAGTTIRPTCSYYLYAMNTAMRLTAGADDAETGLGLVRDNRRTRQPIVSNNPAESGSGGRRHRLPGTDTSLSFGPRSDHRSDRVLGLIILESYERENAYGDSEVRLLTTIAACMGVALENARLFDETQRLLKETEQRAAELAIINSMQEGLASKLDLQAIVRSGRRQAARNIRCRLVGIRCSTRSQPGSLPVPRRSWRATFIRVESTAGGFTGHDSPDAATHRDSDRRRAESTDGGTGCQQHRRRHAGQLVHLRPHSARRYGEGVITVGKHERETHSRSRM